MIRNNFRGFSLVELLIAAGIGGAVILGIAALMMSAYTQSHLLIDAADAEIDEMRAMNALQNVFSQAINVKFFENIATGNDLNGYSGSDGQIREFDSDTYWTDATREAYPVAAFWREAQNSKENPQTGGPFGTALSRTAVFFQKPRAPVAGARSTWGVLYISQSPVGGPALSATRSDQIFEGFTRLQISNVTTYNSTTTFRIPGAGDPVTSFDLKLTFRRFTGQNTNDQRSFCPEQFIADCPPNVAYKDIVRETKITLRNNPLDYSPSGPSSARLYDMIYFMHPRLPGSKR